MIYCLDLNNFEKYLKDFKLEFYKKINNLD